jgi:hypothetical protein
VKGWQRRFEQPIALPDGRHLVTLRDAGNYLASLSAKEAALPHWQTAARELLISAERGGIILLSQWAMLQAIHQGEKSVFNPDRKEHHWGKRQLKRDE